MVGMNSEISGQLIALCVPDKERSQGMICSGHKSRTSLCVTAVIYA